MQHTLLYLPGIAVAEDQNCAYAHAACVVTLVDRLIHRCEVIHIEGQSYRAKEAKERAASKRAMKPI